jgi:hypothetical protein
VTIPCKIWYVGTGVGVDVSVGVIVAVWVGVKTAVAVFVDVAIGLGVDVNSSTIGAVEVDDAVGITGMSVSFWNVRLTPVIRSKPTKTVNNFPPVTPKA